MKITIVAPVYRPSMGGLQIHIHEYARQFLEKGHKVSIIVPNLKMPWLWFNYKQPKYPKYEIIEDIEVFRLTPRFKLFWKIIHMMINKLNIRGAFRILKLILRDNIEMSWGPWVYAEKMILKTNPDVIVLFAPFFRIIKDCIKIRTKYNVPVVVLPIFHIKTQRLEKYIVKLFPHIDIICPSTSMEKDFFVKAGAKSEIFIILGCGLNPEQITYPLTKHQVIEKYNLPSGFRICYLGRIAPSKGVLDLIDAIEILFNKNIDVSLVLAGITVFNTEIIEQRIKNLPRNHQEKIRIISNFAEKDKHSLISVMDIISLPSLADSFGIVLLEGWINKKPVITCENSPPGEVTEDAGAGLCYASGNPAELADSILKLKEDVNLYQKLAQNGYSAVINKYTWSNMVDHLLDAIDKI
ncbi:glycosyltransferase family 4 protein [bacterium]|nr:glycosyltransferase family 4 protein [bacterium]